MDITPPGNEMSVNSRSMLRVLPTEGRARFGACDAGQTLPKTVPNRALVLAQLLEGVLFPGVTETSKWQSSWAMESMNRALTLLQLYLSLERARSLPRHREDPFELRYALSHRLSRDFIILSQVDIEEPYPTTDLVREIIINLGRLFGPAIGNVAVLAYIPPLKIDVVKRRALALLGANLMMSALLHSFPGRTTGKFLVRLHSINGHLARFDFEHDGIPPAQINCEFEQDILVSLVSILKAEMITRLGKDGHAKREFMFAI